ncbi:hypothetical protein CVT24_011468 [Panaeolus cyanescens]|uniref:SH3 domain-containing protein n=1 Tax=Panaeolus cyanescens TaxID=181874 RepID=A0A409YGV5_9AGAR|nr:hypothetical protein CVT24_011468 [Panaeolus cyanescens]
MKLTSTAFIAAAIASLVPAAFATPSPAITVKDDLFFSSRAIEERDMLVKRNPGRVEVDGLRYRRCPRTSSDCPAIGQYAIGTPVDVICLRWNQTTVVENSPYWVRLGNGYYVAFGSGYVSWQGGIPRCNPGSG